MMVSFRVFRGFVFFAAARVGRFEPSVSFVSFVSFAF